MKPETPKNIHIVTIHWGDSRWVDIQLSQLRKNISIQSKIYCGAKDLSERDKSKFDLCIDVSEAHGINLNLIASRIIDTCDPSDLLIFIDGDAFPIKPCLDIIIDSLERFPLIAVRRDECLGDLQPHPCFCATTIGFWKSIDGDWRAGKEGWINNRGDKVSDVGGVLLNFFEEKEVGWLPLLRSNSHSAHEMYFGIYHGFLYHHGAGFRNIWSRLDASKFFWFKSKIFRWALTPSGYKGDLVSKLADKVKAEVRELFLLKDVCSYQKKLTLLSKNIHTLISEGAMSWDDFDEVVNAEFAKLL